MAKKAKPNAGAAGISTPSLAPAQPGTAEQPPDKPPKKAKEPTPAERIAADLRRDAKALRASADRQEADKELCKRQPLFVTAIRAKRKMADELEAKAAALTS